MSTYIYMKGPSNRRNKNVSVTVWKVKNNKPKRLGTLHRNTAAWKGAKPTAAQIVAKKEGYSFDGYRINRKDVNIIRLRTP